MNFDDAISLEERAIKDGFRDGLNSKIDFDKVHIDAANTGLVKGFNEGFKMGYHIGISLFDLNLKNNENLKTIKKTKIQKELIENVSKLHLLSLDDDNFVKCLDKNMEFLDAISKNINFKCNINKSLDF